MNDFKYSEHGPQTDTVTQGSEPNQAALYQELKLYNLTDELEDGCDFFKLAEIDGIQYYHPNDETWGGIIAISEADQLAINTTFYEMDDMARPAPYDDYKQVVSNGVMGCKFQFESF